MGNINDFHMFKMWCHKVLPLVYDDSLSYYETLCKVVDYLNNYLDGFNALNEQVTTNSNNIKGLEAELKIINSEIEKIKKGDYVSLYIDALAKWIDTNLVTMVARIVKYVFFGLTDDGHFAAYVPDSWDFISFDTNVDPTSEKYGHLYLYY